MEAIHSYKRDKESTLKIISKYTQITDPDSLDRTYQAYIKILPEVPLPAPEGVKTFLDYMPTPEAAKADPNEFVSKPRLCEPRLWTAFQQKRSLLWSSRKISRSARNDTKDLSSEPFD